MRTKALFAVLSLAAVQSGFAQSFTISQIGTDANKIHRVSAITNSGFAAGSDASLNKPWRWTSSGGLTVLPTFGTRGQGDARTVNELGVCAGWASNNAFAEHSSLWSSSGTISNIDSGGKTKYSLSAMNDASSPIVVGMMGNSPAIYQSGRWSTLPSFTGLGRAFGIDTAGRIVGICFAANQSERVVIWTKNSSGVYQLDDLTATYGMVAPNYGPGGEDATSPVVIRAGRVACLSTILDLTTGAVTDLSTTGQAGVTITALNSAGQAVGFYSRPRSYDLWGFQWDGAAFIDLSDLVVSSGWTISSPTGINDNGLIVGMGVNATFGRAFVLDLTP